jgi:TPR repeat protein
MGTAAMNRAITSALLAIAALSLAGCDEAPTKTEVAQSPKSAQAEAAKSFDAAVAAYDRNDFTTALRIYRELEAQGHARAQFNLGMMYHAGLGVARDYREAARIIRLAAAQGDAEAQWQLGAEYVQGRGVPQDYLLAHMWSNLGAAALPDKHREHALSLRDDIARRITPAQIAEAQAMARKCQATNFKKCD